METPRFCESVHPKNSKDLKVGIEPAWLTGTKLENYLNFLSLSKAKAKDVSVCDIKFVK